VDEFEGEGGYFCVGRSSFGGRGSWFGLRLLFGPFGLAWSCRVVVGGSAVVVAAITAAGVLEIRRLLVLTR
jgi:hypothetical protein